MGEKENEPEVSRRSFLRVIAAGIGASALEGLSVQEVEAQAPRQRWDMTADFVTIGANDIRDPAFQKRLVFPKRVVAQCAIVKTLGSLRVERHANIC